MSTSPNQIFIKQIENKEATFELLLSILDCVENGYKMCIRSSSRDICYDMPAYPDDVIYFNMGFLFIPEKILQERICGTTYLGIEDIVNVLKDVRIKHKKLLNDDFYKELTVITPVGGKKVDTLVFNYKPFAWLIGCLENDPD